MKVWITKYALSEGIQEKEAELCGDGYRGMIQVTREERPGYFAYFHGGDGKNWHSTRESAIKTAETMRLAKIKSLQKQITKLVNMEF